MRHARGLVALQRHMIDALPSCASASLATTCWGALMAARAESDDPLPLEAVAGLPLDLVVAGHVTVTRAIGSALALVFREPELRDQLLDPELAPLAIEEILRLESPAQGLFRVTTRPAEIGGAELPEGARVMVHFGSSNRDECVFSDADRVDPERDELGKHPAFGKGIHFCIGAPLARLELKIVPPPSSSACPACGPQVTSSASPSSLPGRLQAAGGRVWRPGAGRRSAPTRACGGRSPRSGLRRAASRGSAPEGGRERSAVVERHPVILRSRAPAGRGW